VNGSRLASTGDGGNCWAATTGLLADLDRANYFAG
jgi:hypothetical protein